MEHQDELPAEKKMKPNSGDEYGRLLSELARQLKLARHPNSLTVIKAARLVVEQMLSSKEHGTSHGGDNPGADRPDGAREREIRIQQCKFRLEDVPLPECLDVGESTNQLSESNKSQLGSGGVVVTDGAKTKDELKFERAARALKLLYLDDQKQLQNRVNETISAIQSITANPKTDPRLLASGH